MEIFSFISSVALYLLTYPHLNHNLEPILVSCLLELCAPAIVFLTNCCPEIPFLHPPMVAAGADFKIPLIKIHMAIDRRFVAS